MRSVTPKSIPRPRYQPICPGRQRLRRIRREGTRAYGSTGKHFAAGRHRSMTWRLAQICSSLAKSPQTPVLIFLGCPRRVVNMAILPPKGTGARDRSETRGKQANGNANLSPHTMRRPICCSRRPVARTASPNPGTAATRLPSATAPARNFGCRATRSISPPQSQQIAQIYSILGSSKKSLKALRMNKMPSYTRYKNRHPERRAFSGFSADEKWPPPARHGNALSARGPLEADFALFQFLWDLAGPTGLEPATSCVTGRRSNQLNYDPA